MSIALALLVDGELLGETDVEGIAGSILGAVWKGAKAAGLKIGVLVDKEVQLSNPDKQHPAQEVEVRPGRVFSADLRPLHRRALMMSVRRYPEVSWPASYDGHSDSGRGTCAAPSAP